MDIAQGSRLVSSFGSNVQPTPARFPGFGRVADRHLAVAVVRPEEVLGLLLA